MSIAITSPLQTIRNARHVRRLTSTIFNAYTASMPEHRLRRLLGPAADLRTYTTFAERQLLLDEATAALHRPGAVGRLLEVGSYLGATAAVLAESLVREGWQDRGQVLCVDTWRNDAMTEGQHDTFGRFTENTLRWASLITPIRSDSAAAIVPGPQEMDLVFIDGDHSYEGCRTDLDRFIPLLAENGRLLLHDHCSKAGVARALGELLQTGDWVINRVAESMVSLKRSAWESLV